MAITNGNKPILDRKYWTNCCPAPVAAAAGMSLCKSTLPDQLVMYITSTTVIYLYDPAHDGFVQLPTSGLAGTFGAGTCVVHHRNGPTGTATAGSASTLTTSLTIVANMAGYKIRITSGTGAGQEKTILHATTGANSVITVSTNWTTNPDATSQFVILSGRFWVWNAGTASTFGFRYYDVATASWSSALNAAPASLTTWGTEGRLVVTPGDYQQFVSSTATSGGATTLTDSTKSWTTNQFTNFQVRITVGTGAGQVRTIASNTSTALTVSSAWTTNPDGTSTYVVEGNDDFIYLLGNAAVTMYRYSISGNTWTTLSPGVARSAAPGAGLTAHWIHSITDVRWSTEASIRNGRFIYSFRGGASTALDIYDIAANSWSVGVYGPVSETFSVGTSSNYDGSGHLYIQKDATGRFFRFDVADATLRPWPQWIIAQGAAVAGNRTVTIDFVSGTDKVIWVYHLGTTSTLFMRCMEIG
jgi:hypothetical protein